MAYQDVIYEKRDHVAFITLNRPERGNAWSMLMHKELGEIWRDFKADDSTWVAVVTGAGDRSFCTGADILEVAEYHAKKERGLPVPPDPPFTTDEARQGYPATHSIWKPIIAAVNGHCAGAGLHLVTQTDIVIAAENATFSDPHVSISYVGASEMIELSQRLPLGSVLRMAFAGNKERMPARRAYELGLVEEVVVGTELMAAAEALAMKITSNAPLAVQAVKEAIYQTRQHSYEDALVEGLKIGRRVTGTEDQREGSRAFAEKRPPRWAAR